MAIRISLFPLTAAIMGAALIGMAGAAKAQDYGRDDYGRGYDDGYRRGYEDSRGYQAPDRYGAPEESVIVRPEFGVIQREKLPGWNGVGKFFNPEERLTLSEPVSYSDLDLRYAADRAELRHRISRTASVICARIEAHAGAGSIMETTRQECVSDAVRQALYEVPHR